MHEPKRWKWKSGREFGNQTELYLIGTALQEEKSSRQKFVSGETTVGKSWMGLVGLLGRVGGPFKPPSRDGCDLATVAPLPLVQTWWDLNPAHRCPQLTVETLLALSSYSLFSPPFPAHQSHPSRQSGGTCWTKLISYIQRVFAEIC